MRDARAERRPGSAAGSAELLPKLRSEASRKMSQSMTNFRPKQQDAPVEARTETRGETRRGIVRDVRTTGWRPTSTGPTGPSRRPGVYRVESVPTLHAEDDLGAAPPLERLGTAEVPLIAERRG